MSPVIYAAACVLVPSAWAVLVFYVFGWLDKRRAKSARPAVPRNDDLPPADYMI